MLCWASIRKEHAAVTPCAWRDNTPSMENAERQGIAFSRILSPEKWYWATIESEHIPHSNGHLLWVVF